VKIQHATKGDLSRLDPTVAYIFPLETTPAHFNQMAPRPSTRVKTASGMTPNALPPTRMTFAGRSFVFDPPKMATTPFQKATFSQKVPAKTRPEIYVMGCRNPYRISIDQKTNYLYWGKVGPDAGSDSSRGPRGYDEINQARKAGNFGWPYFSANNKPYTDYDFAEKKTGKKFNFKKPINTSVNNTGLTELPPAQPAFWHYPRASACAGPGISLRSLP
jgi:cytochrome c